MEEEGVPESSTDARIISSNSVPTLHLQWSGRIEATALQSIVIVPLTQAKNNISTRSQSSLSTGNNRPGVKATTNSRRKKRNNKTNANKKARGAIHNPCTHTRRIFSLRAQSTSVVWLPRKNSRLKSIVPNLRLISPSSPNHWCIQENSDVSRAAAVLNNDRLPGKKARGSVYLRTWGYGCTHLQASTAPPGTTDCVQLQCRATRNKKEKKKSKKRQSTLEITLMGWMTTADV